MINFWHRLLNPHCEHCREELQDSRICQSCEALKLEVEYLKFHNNKLLESLIDATRKEIEPTRANTNLADLQPLLTKNAPWSVRRQALELEARKRAQQNEITAEEAILRERANRPLVAVEELEQSLGVSDAS